MLFGSVCSGIEAASVAWEPLGWRASWFAEIESFPSAVLAHHWPSVKNLGDMTKIADMVKAGKVIAPDVLVGGTPCQSWSLAGLRQGLSDSRGQLTLAYTRLADEIDKKRISAGLGESIIVWENVPGIFSDKKNGFGWFLAALAGEDDPLQPPGKRWANAGCVYGPKRSIAWRVIDAQYFGVPQRRRRVFVIASARDGFDPGKILFEFDGSRRDNPPGRETRQETSTKPGSGFGLRGAGFWAEGIGPLRNQDKGGWENLTIAPTLLAGHNKTGGHRPPGSTVDTADSLVIHGGENIFAFRACGQEGFSPSNTCPPILSSDGGGSGVPSIFHGSQEGLGVRRLTPVECARLQGFPDNHTRIPWRGKPAEECPDGPQYAAYGNSMAVPVMHWLGKRIKNYIENQERS